MCSTSRFKEIEKCMQVSKYKLISECADFSSFECDIKKSFMNELAESENPTSKL